MIIRLKRGTKAQIQSAILQIGEPALATDTNELVIQGNSEKIFISTNADTVDGYHLDQDVRTVASPTFAGLTLSGLAQGSIPFAGSGGVVSQNNANLFWDNTNKRLGIGTATPAVSLVVNNNNDASYLRIQGYGDSDNFSALELWNLDGTKKWQFALKSSSGQVGDFAFSHYDGTNWSNPFVITDTGNVGIGTTTPQTKLHVVKSNGAAYLRIQGVSDGDNYGALELWNADGSNKWQVAHKSIAGQTGSFSFAHFDGTSWSAPFTITNSGNVGIGTTTPVGKLHVAGDNAIPFAMQVSTVAVTAPGAGIGMLRWEAGTIPGTLKLVAYSGTSTTGVTIVDNVGGGN